MNAILSLPAENPVGFYLLNVTLSVTVLASLGLLTARVLVARPTPLRHGFLMATLWLVFLSPLLVLLSLHWNLGMFSLPSVLQLQPDRLERIVYASEAVLPSNLRCPHAEQTKETTWAPWPDLSAWSQVWRWFGMSLLAFWAVGMAWQSVVLSRGLGLVRRLRRSLREVEDARWSFLAAKASQAVGLRRPAEVALSDLVSSPLSLGILHPVIVLPASVERVLREEEMEGILLHEAAHIAQRDHLTGLVQRLVQVVFWWHPLVRIFCGALDEIKEELCDNYVVLSQGSGVPFARCLVRLAELALCQKTLPTALGVLGGRRHLEYRVTNLLRKQRQVMTRMTRRMAVAVTLFVLAAGSLMAASTVKAATPRLDTEGTQEEKILAWAEKDVQRWIEQLSSSRFKDREQAAQELRKLFGKDFVAALKKFLKSSDPEGSRRARELIFQSPSARKVDDSLFSYLESILKEDVSSIWLEDKNSNSTMEITQGPQGAVSFLIMEAAKDAQGIAMTVIRTKNGKEVKKEYKAKDAKELETEHPEAHKVYKTVIDTRDLIKVAKCEE